MTNKKKFSDELNIEKTKPHIKKTNKGEMYVETERITFTGNDQTLDPKKVRLCVWVQTQTEKNLEFHFKTELDHVGKNNFS